MKKSFLFLISFLIGTGLFIWVIKFVGLKKIKDAFLVFTGWQGLIILILTLLILLIGTLKWRMILRAKGGNFPFLDLFKIYLASFSLMYFLPIIILGGEIFRGYILKKRKFLPLKKGISSSFIDRILDWTTSLIIIFFGASFFLFKIGLPSKRVAIIFGLTFLFFLAAISFFYIKTFKRESIAKLFLRFLGSKYLDKRPLATEEEIFSFFDLKKMIMWKGFFLAFLGSGFYLLRTWILVSFLGKNIGFLSSLSVLGFSSLARMVPIPANLGSHETIQIFVFRALGLGAGTATAFTMIIRGAELSLAFLGIFILFRLGFSLLKDNLLKNNKNFNS